MRQNKPMGSLEVMDYNAYAVCGAVAAVVSIGLSFFLTTILPTDGKVYALADGTVSNLMDL